MNVLGSSNQPTATHKNTDEEIAKPVVGCISDR